MRLGVCFLVCACVAGLSVRQTHILKRRKGGAPYNTAAAAFCYFIKRKVYFLLKQNQRDLDTTLLLKAPMNAQTDVNFAKLLTLVASVRAFDSLHPIYVRLQWSENRSRSDALVHQVLFEEWKEALRKLDATTISFPSLPENEPGWLYTVSKELHLERVIHIARQSVAVGHTLLLFEMEVVEKGKIETQCTSPGPDETCIFRRPASAMFTAASNNIQVNAEGTASGFESVTKTSSDSFFTWSEESCVAPWDKLSCGVENKDRSNHQNCNDQMDAYWTRVWRRLPALFQSTQDSAPAIKGGKRGECLFFLFQ